MIKQTKLVLLSGLLLLGLAACSTAAGSSRSSVSSNAPVKADSVQLVSNETSATATPTPNAAPTTVATPIQVATKISDKDGAVEIMIPAGEFTMGAVNDPDARIAITKDHSYIEIPSFKYTLPDYWIDKFAVTNAQWQKCVAAGACTQEKTGLFSYPNYATDAKYANYPAVSISWYMASAYCKWAGRRLPTEAEWEKAARGPDARKYPWGNEVPDGTRANYCNKNCPRPWALSTPDDGYAEMAPVGSYPAGASPYGVMDMAGNVWNWTSTLLLDYPYNPNDGREDQNAPGERVWRGGTWSNGPWWLRSSLRYHSPATYYITNLGVRCAESN